MPRRVLLSALAGLACWVPGASAALPALHVGAPSGPAGLAQIVDADGRTVLLRGVNVNGLEDMRRPDLQRSYPIDPAAYENGACPADDPSVLGVALCRPDFAQLRAMGYDVIRLPLSWSELEPQPGQISATYVDRIAQVVGWARAQGIYVLLDMHQDGWSKYLGPGAAPCPPPTSPATSQDGAPLWASAHVAPMCAPEGISELAPGVAEAFQRFYANAAAPDGAGLQDHFAAAVTALARRFAGDPTVAGYELLNEPHPGMVAVPGAMDAAELFPFYAKVVAAVTAAVPGFDQLFFVEPNAERNVTDQGPVLTPWAAYSSYRNVVFAPHVYTGVFTADAEAGQHVFPSDGGYVSAIRDAKVLGLPLWIGEFGGNPGSDDTILAGHYAQQDADALGGALWVWREHGSWGVFATPHGDVPTPTRLKYSSRAYPLFTAGTLDSLAYDPADGAFRMTATSAAVAPSRSRRATRIFVPAAASGAVAASGARIRVRDLAGGAREVLAFPRGGPYSISVACRC
jgi:endoglycosylceramidase